ncbi:MAG: hypothetical protein OEZ34_07610, partial [Spirochaetia bacterium]|nr:hypothetical protein [Spirochaetia bacterium]
GFPKIWEYTVGKVVALDKLISWRTEHVKFTFGADTLNQLISRASDFDEKDWPKNITCDTLIFISKNDDTYNPNLGRAFTEKLTNAKSVETKIFSADEGGGLHCQCGAYYLSLDSLFEWLNQRKFLYD